MFTHTKKELLLAFYCIITPVLCLSNTNPVINQDVAEKIAIGLVHPSFIKNKKDIISLDDDNEIAGHLDFERTMRQAITMYTVIHQHPGCSPQDIELNLRYTMIPFIHKKIDDWYNNSEKNNRKFNQQKLEIKRQNSKELATELILGQQLFKQSKAIHKHFKLLHKIYSTTTQGTTT